MDKPQDPEAAETDQTTSVPAVDLPRLVVPSVGDNFYSGIEWLACWLLDNCEGEEITEEQLRPWAAKAREAHVFRHNA